MISSLASFVRLITPPVRRQSQQSAGSGRKAAAAQDFGAGYTSVQQIIEYPAETIKLDRELVESLTRSAALPTLRALVALCHAQDMSVIAEGVDTTEKMGLLAAAGCDFYQGYLICKPQPLEDLGIWAMQRLVEKARDAAHSPERRARA